MDLSAELFVRHLAERLPEVSPGSPLAPVLESLSLAELYLACACAQGLPLATRLFETHYLAKLPGMLGYLKQPSAALDDICQLTRVKLLVRTPESGPRINDYTGRGALMSWVRVTAVRIALKLQAADKPEPEEDVAELIEALPAPGRDAELDLIRQRHQAELRQAIRDAFSALSSDERHLLRLYFVDKLSTTELGALLRVNQSTVSRWLKSARQTVHDETRRHLRARLNLSAAGFQSFLDVLDSQLDLSISQLFGEEDRLAGERGLEARGGAEPGPVMKR
ncbi:sigma-70 family RNA polymerase sigma factor [Pyxidicoccus fallax]|uniref:sigma-70 family RNA polymerase sigma factor n=1 Tax=Pyxidicoccus fallax TaxID=394095 RepID=UPI0031B64740